MDHRAEKILQVFSNMNLKFQLTVIMKVVLLASPVEVHLVE